MRASAVLPAVSNLLFLSLVVVIVSGADTTDECGTVDVALKFGTKDFGTIIECLCASAIPTFIDSNTDAEAAVAYAGRTAVINLLTTALDDSSNHKECSYPEYSSPVCTTQNPCDFTCTNGFTASPDLKPTECICVFPFSVCNGECGLFFSCHSNLAKRQDDMWKKTGCNRGWSPCGVFGGRRRAWECVNTQSDLESCGGCMYPLQSEPPTGVDCTSIEGVSDVSCFHGSCAVQRCRHGWSVSPDGTSCVPSAHMNQTLTDSYNKLQIQNRV